jgi:hypothetical protein
MEGNGGVTPFILRYYVGLSGQIYGPTALLSMSVGC